MSKAYQESLAAALASDAARSAASKVLDDAWAAAEPVVGKYVDIQCLSLADRNLFPCCGTLPGQPAGAPRQEPEALAFRAAWLAWEQALQASRQETLRHCRAYPHDKTFEGIA